jgi:hypothetical protein
MQGKTFKRTGAVKNSTHGPGTTRGNNNPMSEVNPY